MRILHVGFGFLPLRYGGIIIYAEDMMDAQVARGHDVGYFFPGRRYPVLRHDRLRRWSRRGVSMFELVNSTLGPGGDAGTLRPQDDVSHPPSEAQFARVLEEFRPDVIHIEELIGIPTAVIEIANAQGVPVMERSRTTCPSAPSSSSTTSTAGSASATTWASSAPAAPPGRPTPTGRWCTGPWSTTWARGWAAR